MRHYESFTGLQLLFACSHHLQLDTKLLRIENRKKELSS